VVEAVTEKTCVHCGKAFPLERFTRIPRLKFGRDSHCRICRSKKQYGTPEKLEYWREYMRTRRAKLNSPRKFKYEPVEAVFPDQVYAYLAGLFDAEGTFVISVVGNATRCIVSLYNNDQILLKFAQKALGGNYHQVKRKKRKSTHSDSYVLEFSNKKIIKDICEKLSPYLVLKKKQNDLMLQAVKLKQGYKVNVAEIRGAMRKTIMAKNEKGQKVSEYKKNQDFPGMNFVTETDWAYLAGWVDGDGHIGAQGPQVYCTKQFVMEHLFKKFGGALKFKQVNANWATAGTLCWPMLEAVQILDGILPYLVLKQQVAKDFLTVIRAKRRKVAFVMK